MSQSETDFTQRLIHNLAVTIIAFFIALGAFFYIANSLWGYSLDKVGDWFISGGVFGVVVYFILTKIADEASRKQQLEAIYGTTKVGKPLFPAIQDILGIKENENLLQNICDRDEEAIYLRRSEKWILKKSDKDDNRWDSLWIEEVTLHFRKNEDSFYFERKGNSSIKEINKRNENGMWKSVGTPFNPVDQFGKDASGKPTKSIYKIPGQFKSGELHEFQIKTECEGNFVISGDYVKIDTPLYCSGMIFEIECPDQIDVEKEYDLVGYVYDSCFRRIADKDLDHKIKKNKRIMAVKQKGCNGTDIDIGPVGKGETIFIKYFPKMN